ncbi:MAG: hypothetical protein H3C30_08250 [Candidatus Hydrogenedentes bacterium]|nr:hypothetical protein [Candidatus Hydrogenedentota bacterium]
MIIVILFDLQPPLLIQMIANKYFGNLHLNKQRKGDIMMLYFNYKKYFLSFVYIAFVLSHREAVPEQLSDKSLPTYEQLISKMEASYKQREELLSHSTGKARVRLEGETNKETINYLNLRMEEQGIIAEPIKPKYGNMMEVEWHSNGDYYRYDVVIDKIGDLSEYEPKQHVKYSFNKEYALYYDQRAMRSYINNSPITYGTLAGFINLFDIKRCYKSSNFLLYDMLKSYKPSTILLQRIEEEGMSCIYLSLIDKSSNSNEGDFEVRDNKVWISESQNYTVIKHAAHVERYNNGLLFKTYDYEYKADYEPSIDFPDVWILKNLYQYETQFSDESLWIEFSDVRLGIDVPVETFNFDGFGVPVGAPIFDKRNPGPSTLYYYLPGVYVGLDRLDLAAGAVEMPPDLEFPEQTLPPEPLPEPDPEPTVSQDAPTSQVETGSSSASSSFKSVYFIAAVTILLGCVAVFTFIRKRKQGTRNE